VRAPGEGAIPLIPSEKARHERSRRQYRPDAGEPTLWRQNPLRGRVWLAGGEWQEALPHGGAPGSGAPRANRNARKHGLFTGDAIAERRRLRDLLCQALGLLERLK
jgi:hypothetical protein